MELSKVRTRSGRPALAVLVLIGLICAACGAATAAPGAATAPRTTSSVATTTTTLPPVTFATDATVTVAVSHLPANYNPWTPAGSDSVTAMVMEQVWPSVSVLDNRLATQICTLESAICPSQLLVSAEPISLDPMTVVYQIAPKATWSNGTPVTGADFSYLRDQVVKEAAELPAIDPVAGYEDIRSIVTSGGGKTVTVVFDHPYADWQSLFDDLVPAQIGTADGFTQAFTAAHLADLVSAGPYEITHVIPGHEVVLARNPHYWGPAAHVARLIFRVEPTEQATIAALKDGRVSIAQLPPGVAVDDLVADTPSLLDKTTYSPELWQLAFNLDDPVTGVQDVREAIADAIDRHQLLDETLDWLTGSAATVGNRLFGLGIAGGYGNDSAYAEVDPEDAESLLAAAGYTLSANGIERSPAGTPLVVTLDGPTGDPLASSVEAEVQAELLQVGIEVRIVNQPLAELLGSTLPNGAYAIALVPYDVTPFLSTTAVLYTEPVGTTSLSTPTRLADPNASTSATKAAAPGSAVAGAVSRDVLGLSDPRLAPLFSEAAQELNPSSADDEYNEIDVDLWDDMATLPLYQEPTVTVWNRALSGVTPAQTWTTFLYDAQDWEWELNVPIPTTTVVGTS